MSPREPLAAWGAVDWPAGNSDTADRLRDLWMTFHTLAGRVGRDGTIDDVRADATNASQSAGTRAAATFILHVATGGPFDRARAWANWDMDQRAAFEAWEAAPWHL